MSDIVCRHEKQGDMYVVIARNVRTGKEVTGDPMIYLEDARWSALTKLRAR